MAALFSKGPHTLSAKWKLLAASVLAAGLIALLCGQCESFTKAACMKITASLLLPIDQKPNATHNKLKNDITFLTTILSTTTTSETSLSGYAATSLKKSATFIAANMARKISDLTIMPVSSTAHLTINSSINKAKALLPMRAKLYKISGHLDSAQLANLTSKQRRTQLDIFLKKLMEAERMTLTCDLTNTALPSGSDLHTLRCP